MEYSRDLHTQSDVTETVNDLEGLRKQLKKLILTFKLLRCTLIIAFITWQVYVFTKSPIALLVFSLFFGFALAAAWVSYSKDIKDTERMYKEMEEAQGALLSLKPKLPTKHSQIN